MSLAIGVERPKAKTPFATQGKGHGQRASGGKGRIREKVRTYQTDFERKPASV
jgi:hypothetical protein